MTRSTEVIVVKGMPEGDDFDDSLFKFSHTSARSDPAHSHSLKVEPVSLRSGDADSRGKAQSEQVI